MYQESKFIISKKFPQTKTLSMEASFRPCSSRFILKDPGTILDDQGDGLPKRTNWPSRTTCSSSPTLRQRCSGHRGVREPLRFLKSWTQQVKVPGAYGRPFSRYCRYILYDLGQIPGGLDLHRLKSSNNLCITFIKSNLAQIMWSPARSKSILRRLYLLA